LIVAIVARMCVTSTVIGVEHVTTKNTPKALANFFQLRVGAFCDNPGIEIK